MGLVNAQVFIGTRCRLCRHKDAKFVNGWVQYFRGDSLVVTTENTVGSEPGDEFYLEAYGPKMKGSVDAQLIAVVNETDPVEGASEGSSKLSLRLKGPLRVSDHSEASRMLVDGMSAQVQVGEAKFQAKVRDVSLAGIGLVSDQEFVKGTEVVLTIESSVGQISATGVVRHVRKHQDKFRVGVELLGLSRLDGSRWRKLMGAAA